MSLLPSGDYTPENYQIPITKFSESLKRPIRHLVYPIYNAINHSRLKSEYMPSDFDVDLLLWGQRGNDYDRHRRRVSKFLSVKDKNVLVAGCGTGRDIESWVRLNPKRVEGVDWFSHEKAWKLWRDRFSEIRPKTEIVFNQADLGNMTNVPTASVDIVSSDAVFEHIKNIPEVLKEFHRILRPGGVLYSTFGPLWYTWGGDHVSGFDDVYSGFNHLLLKGQAYEDYLDSMGSFSHSEHDGRTWIKHDLFSRLKAKEYLKHLDEGGFNRLFVSAIVDPHADTCLKNPDLKKKLLDRFERTDLLLSGMTIIYQRP